MTLTTRATLLLTALTASLCVPTIHPKSNTPARGGAQCHRGSYCGRCSHHCARNEATVAPGENPAAAGRRQAEGEGEGEHLRAVLQWALELSLKINTLPPPSSSVLQSMPAAPHSHDQNLLSHDMHATLEAVSRQLCRTCTPLYATLLSWQPLPVSPEVRTLTQDQTHAPLFVGPEGVGVEFSRFIRRSQGCLPRSSDSADIVQQNNMQQFGIVLISSLHRCVELVFLDLVQGGQQKDRGEEHQLRVPSDLNDDHTHEPVVLAGASLISLWIGVSGLVDVLQNHSSEHRAPPIMRDQEAGWLLAQQCLHFLRDTHHYSVGHCVPSCAILSHRHLLATLCRVLDLLDALLFMGDGLARTIETNTTFAHSDDAKEEVLLALEVCLETMDDFGAWMIVLMSNECAHVYDDEDVENDQPDRHVHTSTPPSSSSVSSASVRVSVPAPPPSRTAVSFPTRFASIPSALSSWHSGRGREGERGDRASSKNSDYDSSVTPEARIARYSSRLIQLLSKCYS